MVVIDCITLMYVTSLFWVTYLIRPALIQNNPTSDSSDWLYYIDVCHVLILGHVFDSSRSNTEQTYRMSYIPKYSN